MRTYDKKLKRNCDILILFQDKRRLNSTFSNVTYYYSGFFMWHRMFFRRDGAIAESHGPQGLHRK